MNRTSLFLMNSTLVSMWSIFIVHYYVDRIQIKHLIEDEALKIHHHLSSYDNQLFELPLTTVSNKRQCVYFINDLKHELRALSGHAYTVNLLNTDTTKTIAVRETVPACDKHEAVTLVISKKE